MVEHLNGIQGVGGSNPPTSTILSRWRALIPVAIVTAAYTITAALVTSRTSNAEFMIYIGVMVILFGLIGWLHTRIGLTTPTLWCLSLWGFLHMAGGLVPVPESWPIAGDIRVLYSWWLIPSRLKYDQVVHAYGFGVTTWVCWQGLSAAFRCITPNGSRDAKCTAGRPRICLSG